MSPIAVAFLADYFVSWMGGAQLLANMLNCMGAIAANQNVRVEVLMNARALGKDALPDLQDYVRVRVADLRATGPLQCLLGGAKLEHIVFYRDLPRALKALSIQVIAPTGENLGDLFPIPWFAYIPDFQHQYLGRFFQQEDRMFRDRQFRALVENSRAVFVTSGSAAADVERFYPAAARARQVLRLPLALPQLDRVADPVETTRLYDLQRPFFLSCSQRWLHKQHPLILRAFADFVAHHPDATVDLVFTGETGDYRAPTHAGEVDELVEALGLRERVRVLGLIPREHQLALIQQALAVVQASLFEGQAGASGTMEAGLLGTRIVASDIGTNRELPFGRQRFFEAESSGALSRHLAAVVAEAGTNSDSETNTNLPFDPLARQLLEMASGLQLLSTLRSAALPA